MRKVLMFVMVVGLVMGLSNIGFASLVENITINACKDSSPTCTNGRSGSDFTLGEYRNYGAGVFDISVVSGAWGTEEVTDFNSPSAVHYDANGGQFWLWSLAIYNGVDYFMLGDHSPSGASISHPFMSTPPYYNSKSGAQAAALTHNLGDSITVSTTGDLWFYVYDPSNRDNEGSLTFDIAVAPEPVSTTLFIIGGVVMGGRSFLRRKRNK